MDFGFNFIKSHNSGNLDYTFVSTMASTTCIFSIFAILVAAANCQLVSEAEFVNAVVASNYSRPPSSKYNFFVNGLKKGGVSTKLEAAILLAQFLHESGGLTRVREGTCKGQDGGSSCNKYPDSGYDTTVGCSVSGRSYYGRGYIQLTYCQNYRRVSTELYGNPDVLRNDPDKVAREESVSWDAAFNFWLRVVHPKLSEPGNANKFGVATFAVNGERECERGAKVTEEGRKHARHRFKIYKQVFKNFNLPSKPNPAGCY